MKALLLLVVYLKVHVCRGPLTGHLTIRQVYTMYSTVLLMGFIAPAARLTKPVEDGLHTMRPLLARVWCRRPEGLYVNLILQRLMRPSVR